MKREIVILMIAFSMMLSGCGVILRPFIGVPETEKICKDVAMIVEKDGKGVSRKTSYSYSQTIKILREMFMPHYEFVVEKFGEKSCYGMCKVYEAGVFGKKIRLILINNQKSEIRIWAGKIKIIDGKISENNKVSQVFAEEIFQIIKK